MKRLRRIARGIWACLTAPNGPAVVIGYPDHSDKPFHPSIPVYAVDDAEAFSKPIWAWTFDTVNIDIDEEFKLVLKGKNA